VRVGSSPDNAETDQYCQMIRVRQARRRGIREEPATESPSRRPTSSNLADLGWVAARTRIRRLRGTPWPVDVAGREAVVKVCGVAAAMLQGHSWVPIPSNGRKVNVGTIPVVPNPVSCQLPGGKVRRRLMPPGWGGGPVVVRGRESRPHGEGVQRDRSRRALMGDHR
jgi:hypothetical protein